MLRLSNTILEFVPFVAHGLKLLLGAICLLFNAPEELQVPADVLLGLQLHLARVHVLLGSLKFVLETGLLGEGHAELGELEQHLEVWEEVDHIVNVGGLAHLSQQVALVALAAHIDAFGHILEPDPIAVCRGAVFDLFAVGFSTCKDIVTIVCVGRIFIVHQKLADAVHYFGGSITNRALTSTEYTFDMLKIVSVASFYILSLGFTHSFN